MWFTAPSAIQAPRADVNFMRDALDYANIDSEASQKIVHKFLGHLWYLNPELVCLFLFDESVPANVK